MLLHVLMNFASASGNTIVGNNKVEFKRDFGLEQRNTETCKLSQALLINDADLLLQRSSFRLIATLELEL